MSVSSKLRLLPEDHALGWTPYAWLAFLPAFFVEPASRTTPLLAWTAYAGAIVVFVASYFRAYWASGRELRVHVLVQATIGAAFTPVNTGAYVLFTYAVAAGARAERTREGVAWIVGITAAALGTAYFTDVPRQYWVGYGPFMLLIGAICLHRTQTDRANARLRAANNEIERLAAVAERERIGRDLHDVLGHTLSLIVLKSELASRLAERDPARAAREIRDVEYVSREALKEVRETVRGYRSRLHDELAGARRLLEAAGISIAMDCTVAREAFDGNERVEDVLALAVREAATNVARHSRARRATIRIWHDRSLKSFRLEVADDGIGNREREHREGNGLRGMRERVDAASGTLTLDSAHTGTRLTITLPVPTPPVIAKHLHVVPA